MCGLIVNRSKFAEHLLDYLYQRARLRDRRHEFMKPPMFPARPRFCQVPKAAWSRQHRSSSRRSRTSFQATFPVSNVVHVLNFGGLRLESGHDRCRVGGTGQPRIALCVSCHPRISRYRPIRSISPDWCRRGVRPKTAPTAFDLVKRERAPVTPQSHVCSRLRCS
jgi:hypothetical protein